MSGAIPLLPLYAFVVWSGELHFCLFESSCTCVRRDIFMKLATLHRVTEGHLIIILLLSCYKSKNIAKLTASDVSVSCSAF
jgi:hypothetical protein